MLVALWENAFAISIMHFAKPDNVPTRARGSNNIQFIKYRFCYLVHLSLVDKHTLWWDNRPSHMLS